MRLKSVSTAQVHLYKLDQIPFQKLVTQKWVDELGSLLSFGSAQVAQDISRGETSILCEGGSVETDDGVISISRLAIEDRRILLNVAGTSDDARFALSQLEQFLSDVAGVDPEAFESPVLTAHDSQIVAELDFHYLRLISDSAWNYISQTGSGIASSDFATATLVPAKLAFYVEYEPVNKKLSEYRISLVRKELTLEPRKGYPLDERVFYSKAPFDTGSHQQFLVDLEALLSS